MRNTLRLLVLALVIGPTFSPADKKTDDALSDIQRDVAALEERVKAMQASQKAQDDKLDAMQKLVQQAAAASAQANQDMAALKRDLTASVASAMTDQQNKISGSVAPLGAQMDAVSRSLDALTQTVGQIVLRMNTIDTKLKDLSDKVSILNQPVAPPPAAVNVPAPVDPNAPPPGVTPISLHGDAESNYAKGNDDIAVKEFSDYIKYFPQDAYAPTAGYLIGMIYLRQKDYDGAAQAFQDVIDHFPGINQSQNALFQRGIALENGGHKQEAIKALNQFVSLYPANDYWAQAKKELAKLQPPPGAGRGKGRGPVK